MGDPVPGEDGASGDGDAGVEGVDRGRAKSGEVSGDRSDDGSADGPGATDGAGTPAGGDTAMSDLFDELAELEGIVDSPEEREQVRETMRAARDAEESPVFGQVVFGFDRSDAAEALLGALLFGIPMFVEGGTQEVGAYVATHPLFFVATNALTVCLVIAILYVADIQDVRVMDPLFGVLPRKLLGVLLVSVGTALFMMTAWGRVDWAQPWLAVCQISVAWVPMAIGAALGDLLPG